MNVSKNMVFYWPYLIVPILIPLVIYDMFWGGKSLQHIEVTKIIPFVLIFNLPHIIYSFFPLVRREVRNEVEKKTLFGFVIIIFLSIVGVLYAPEKWSHFVILVTAYHLARQQIGILMISLDIRNEKVIQRLKTWTHIFVSLEILNYITVIHHTDIQIFVLCAATIIFGVHTHIFSHQELKLGKDERNKLYLVYSSLILSTVSVSIGYLYIAFFIMRFLHDLQAFTLYILRDISLDSLTLSLPNIIKISIYPLTVILACDIWLNGYDSSGTIFASVIGMSHYYLESYFWKRGTLSVKHLRNAMNSLS